MRNSFRTTLVGSSLPNACRAGKTCCYLGFVMTMTMGCRGWKRSAIEQPQPMAVTCGLLFLRLPDPGLREREREPCFGGTVFSPMVPTHGCVVWPRAPSSAGRCTHNDGRPLAGDHSPRPYAPMIRHSRPPPLSQSRAQSEPACTGIVNPLDLTIPPDHLTHRRRWESRIIPCNNMRELNDRLLALGMM